MGRDIIQYIDIHDTSNGHIEIDNRMRSIHDHPRGERVVTMLKSVTITPTRSQRHWRDTPKKLLAHILPIGIVETKIKVLP